MPNPLVSEIQSKQGDVFDIAAKRFSGNRTVTMTGDVTGSESGWNGSGELSISTTIATNAVTTQKIADKAVTTEKIDDGAVGLTQIDSNAMNGTVQDNDSNLATHAAVKTYVDSQISGQGTYLGKHTVAEINAFTTSDLHNGDRVMVSDSGTINLGPGGAGFDVVAGEDLILYKSGSTVQWDSMDGNFKTKQTAVTKTSSALKTITSLTQNANGEINATFSDIQDGTTSQKGVVQLLDSHTSTATDKAATPKNVKEAYDLADSKLSPTGDGKDVTSTVTTENNYTNPGSTATKISVLFGKIWNFIGRLRTSWQTTPDDTHFPSEKLVKDGLDLKADANKSVAIADAIVSDDGVAGGLWYKFAELKNAKTRSIENIMGVWELVINRTLYSSKVTLEVNVRIDNSSTPIRFLGSAAYSDDIDVLSDFDFKVVTRGAQGNVLCELWVGRPSASAFFAVNVIERNSANYNSGTKLKSQWTYSSYNGAGVDAPVADATANVLVHDVNKLTRKHTQTAVTDPTASGTALSFIDSISQDANGVITPTKKTIAEASQNTNGLMSSSDKYKLDTISNGAAVYEKYVDQEGGGIYKVCTLTEGVPCGLNLAFRYGDYGVIGNLAYRNGFKLSLTSTNPGTNPDSGVSVQLYYTIASSIVTIYAVAGRYTRSFYSPYANAKTQYVSFTDFGTAVGALPNDAVAIMNRYSATVIGSSSGVPLQSDNVGNLTPCTIDNTPTDNSANLVKSGGVKAALTGKTDKVSNATNGNFAGLDSNGNLTDSGSKASDFATAAQGTAADSAVQDVQIGNTSIVSNHVATIPSAAAGTKGVVEYMTSQEAASLWTNAWSAAT